MESILEWLQRSAYNGVEFLAFNSWLPGTQDKGYYEMVIAISGAEYARFFIN